MPKVVDKPKSKAQIQADSDAKRGVKIKAFKLHIDDIAYIDDLAQQHNLKNNELLIKAIRYYAQEVLEKG